MDRFKILENENILLIENDPVIRQTLIAAFSRVGCRANGFDSAEKGLTEFKNQSFSIVISDFKLPGMDGLVFLQEVMARRKSIATFLISAYVDNDMVVAARKIDVDAVLEKPFTLESLLNVLKERVKDRRRKDHDPGGGHGNDRRIGAATKQS